MASVASDIDPAAEPQVVVEESSSAGGSEVEAPPEAAAAEVVVGKEAAEGEAKAGVEEEGECGFCLYMKGGACKEAFVSWEQCVDAAGSDMVERCAEATINLKNCMEAHLDYYEPVLRVEQHVSDQAEAAVVAAAADADKNKVEESAPSPATDMMKKEEAVVEPAASAADAKEEVIEPAASSMAGEELEKEEALVEKVESLSLGN